MTVFQTAKVGTSVAFAPTCGYAGSSLFMNTLVSEKGVIGATPKETGCRRHGMPGNAKFASFNEVFSRKHQV